jgi:hypothetical protein
MSPTVRPRTILALVGVVLAALAFLGVVALWGDREVVGDQLAIVTDVAERQQEVIDKLADDLDETREQLLKEGIEPSAPPPDKSIQDLPAVDRPDPLPRREPTGPRSAGGRR